MDVRVQGLILGSCLMLVLGYSTPLTSDPAEECINAVEQVRKEIQLVPNHGTDIVQVSCM